MRNVKRLFLFVVLLAAIGAGVWYARARLRPVQSASAAAGPTQLVEVRQGNLTSNLTVVGEVDALQLQDMSFSRMSGTAKLIKVSAEAGNTVKAGQVLATIDPARYQQALDQAKSALQAAETKLAELTTPATKLALAKADLALAKAQLQISQANDNLDKLTNPDVAALQSAVADAERGLAQARVSLASVQNDKATEDNLYKLRDTESKASAVYTRLANETTPDSDVSYRDRLLISFNTLKNAEDARVTAETQKLVNILKAQMQLTKSEATLADAQEALATARAGGDKLALAKAQVALQDAQVALSSAEDSRTTLTQGADATTLAAAQADVDKKRLAVAEAQADLAGTTLVAPFDGTVLQTRVTAGNQIGASTVIMTVANMKGLQVVASVDETTIRRVTVGQNATISFDAFPGQTFRGKVTAVPLQGALQGNVMVYEVPISLTGADALPLLVGMTANVQIQTGQATNAILVPAIAIQQSGGAYQVLMPNEDPQGQPVAVPVEIGLSDGVNTQVTRGLKVGDKVLVQFTTSTTGNNQNNPGVFFEAGPGGGAQFGPGGGGQPIPQPPSR